MGKRTHLLRQPSFCRQDPQRSLRTGEEGPRATASSRHLSSVLALRVTGRLLRATVSTLHPASDPQEFSVCALRCLVCLEMKNSPSCQSPILTHQELPSLTNTPPSLQLGEPTLDLHLGSLSLLPAQLGQPSPAQGRPRDSVEGKLHQQVDPERALRLLLRAAPQPPRPSELLLRPVLGLGLCHRDMRSSTVPPLSKSTAVPTKPFET